MPAQRQILSHNALRGVAALLVVGYHMQFSSYRLGWEQATSFFTQGYLFVDLFFVMSGFIISYVNDAERSRPYRRDEIKGFARSRFARIYPLHLFCLAYLVMGLAVVSVLQSALGKIAVADWDLASLYRLFLQFTLLNAWLPGAPGWNIPTWSISAEVGAYALFPLLVGLHARRRLPTEIGMLLAALVLYAIIVATRGNLDLTTGGGVIRCVAGFMLGMLVYFRRGAIAAISPAMLSLIQLATLAAIVVTLALPLPDIVSVPLFVALVATTWTDRGLLPALLSGRLPQWLGNISYSIYLNHVPIAKLLGFVWSRSAARLFDDPSHERISYMIVYLALVLLISTCTFRYVERPARQWLARRLIGHRVPPIEASPAAP